MFVVQSGSARINDSIMELLIMISACKGGSANKVTGKPRLHYVFKPRLGSSRDRPVTVPHQESADPSLAVLPYFPYSRQSKKKSHRGAITARMLANLLGVAGVKHVITVDLHASQMQGFFKCPVDNLHAEPIIAQWIRLNIPNWREAVVVSKNAGGTKRVTSLADALKLNFGMVTTDKRRTGKTAHLSASVIMAHLDGVERHPALEIPKKPQPPEKDEQPPSLEGGQEPMANRSSRVGADGHGSPTRTLDQPRSGTTGRASVSNPSDQASATQRPSIVTRTSEYDDLRVQDVIQGRLFRGHIVEDDSPSPSRSTAENSIHEDDIMAQSQVSSFFAPEKQALGGSGDAAESSDEDDNALQDPKTEHMITLVGNVKQRTVFIVDDMIDKPGSWIAAAETVVKKGHAKQVFAIATHGVFGGDCLEQLQACECIDAIVVTNSFPIPAHQAQNISKLVVLDISSLLAEAIRRNHYGESISSLFQHY